MATTPDNLTEVPAATPEASEPKPSRRRAATAKIEEKASGLRARATDKAHDIAVKGKDKATGALDSVVRLVDDAAGAIDDKVGEQYGAYARRAAEAIAGVASNLRAKDVDDLVADARDLVRKNPAIAIGAAAAIGFVVARVIKAGGDSHTIPEAPDGEDAEPAA